MKQSSILYNLRGLHVLVLNPEGDVSDSLVLQLIRIGCPVRHLWPPPEDIDFEVDIVFTGIFQDRFYERIKSLSEKLSDEVTIISIVEYESPTVISRLLEIGAHGVISLPLNSNNVLPSLVVARQNSGTIKKKDQEISKHKYKLAKMADINKAKVMLMKEYNITEEEAHKHLSNKSMETRRSLTETSKLILNNLEK